MHRVSHKVTEASGIPEHIHGSQFENYMAKEQLGLSMGCKGFAGKPGLRLCQHRDHVEEQGVRGWRGERVPKMQMLSSPLSWRTKDANKPSVSRKQHLSKRVGNERLWLPSPRPLSFALCLRSPWPCSSPAMGAGPLGLLVKTQRDGHFWVRLRQQRGLSAQENETWPSEKSRVQCRVFPCTKQKETLLLIWVPVRATGCVDGGWFLFYFMWLVFKC